MKRPDTKETVAEVRGRRWG